MTSDTAARDRRVRRGAALVVRLRGVRPRTQVLVFLLLALTVYGATANYSDQQVSDAIAVGLPMWSLVERGTIDVRPYQEMSHWFFEFDGRYLSNRWPGTMLVALPVYALASPWTSAEQPSFWPATVAAALVAAAAVTALFALILRMHGPSVAWGAGIVVAFGTGMWTNAADVLWTHAPAVLTIALVLHALCADRQWLAGAGFGFLAIVRPHLLAAAAMLGYVLARERRDLATLLRLGLPSAVGLAVYVSYSRAVTGDGSALLPYSFAPPTGWERIGNMVGVLVAPRVGLLVYTPIIACCVIMLGQAWRAAAAWERAAFFGGAVYLVVQLQSNYFFGGFSFYGYRLPLEALALMLPLLVRGGVAFVRRGTGQAALAAALAMYSITVSAIGAVFYQATPEVRTAPWTVYGPVDVFAGRPVWWTVAVVALSVAAVVAAPLLVARRSYRAAPSARAGAVGPAGPGGDGELA